MTHLAHQTPTNSHWPGGSLNTVDKASVSNKPNLCDDGNAHLPTESDARYNTSFILARFDQENLGFCKKKIPFLLHILVEKSADIVSALVVCGVIKMVNWLVSTVSVGGSVNWLSIEDSKEKGS
jgi:hypothetical protein